MRKILVTICICTILGLTSLSFAADAWKERRSRHFIVYYKNAPEDFIKTVEESAEGYYDSIIHDLGFSRDQLWTWEDRAKIYIYDDEQEYVKLSRQAPWSSGSTAVGSRVIQTFPTAHGFFDSLLPHELSHIIFREYIGFKTSIPIWLDEGVAMYQEKARRFTADKDVKDAIRDGRFIPLSELSETRLSRNTDKDVVRLFYAEAASAVHYLIFQVGSFKFQIFCDDLKQGSTLNQALERTYYRFKNIKDLNDAWVGYLKK